MLKLGPFILTTTRERERDRERVRADERERWADAFSDMSERHICWALDEYEARQWYETMAVAYEIAAMRLRGNEYERGGGTRET